MANNAITKFRSDLKYRHLLGQLVVKDIKNKYRRSVLGILWTVLHPLLSMGVMYLVFSQFLGREEHFHLFIMTGQIIFHFNSETTNRAMRSIVGHRGLINRIYVPKSLFPLSCAVSSLVNFGFSLIALISVMLFTKGYTLPPHSLMLFVMLPALFLFSLGIGLFLSALNVFFRDVEHLYGVFMTLWMYLSGIFYRAESLKGAAGTVISLNPMHHFISYFRTITLEGAIPTAKAHLICYGCGVASLLIGAFVFSRLKNRFVLHL